MKDFSKIIILSISIFFILSCSNPVKNESRYEGVLNTTNNTRQLITNKCTVIVDEFGSIEITIEGDNGYEGVTNISEEELIQTSDNSYTASKNGKRYSFVFNDGYMTLTIENTDNTTSNGQLSKVN
ncbi:hypothetical protein [Brachyspira alvinipulli]|uniref:hypothetical protein n=1 Tax=Brachyspira alvinipulli TaxID=84379 RepID=UPI0004872973|nr:hypothetical protein [Brachyspira alvinipulli]